MSASDDWSCHCGKRFATLREVNKHQKACFPRVPLYRSTAPKVIANLRAQVKDLKARLSFVEKRLYAAECMDGTYEFDDGSSLFDALDLRQKDWQ